jgi:hypothetical protein
LKVVKDSDVVECRKGVLDLMTVGEGKITDKATHGEVLKKLRAQPHPTISLSNFIRSKSTVNGNGKKEAVFQPVDKPKRSPDAAVEDESPDKKKSKVDVSKASFVEIGSLINEVLASPTSRRLQKVKDASPRYVSFLNGLLEEGGLVTFDGSC